MGMKQRRLPNGKYRINYFERLFPLYLMLLTAGLSWGLQTGNKLKLQVQARGGDNASWVELANATTPTPTPQLQVITPTPIVPTATPTITPTPVIKKTIKARNEIEKEIMNVFGEQGELAIAVGMSESHLIPTKTLIVAKGKYSWSTATYKGECSVGLFMINLAEDNCKGRHIHYSKVPGETMEEKIEWLKVPSNNIKMAKEIYDSRGNFGDWSGYTGGGYKKFYLAN